MDDALRRTLEVLLGDDPPPSLLFGAPAIALRQLEAAHHRETGSLDPSRILNLSRQISLASKRDPELRTLRRGGKEEKWIVFRPRNAAAKAADSLEVLKPKRLELVPWPPVEVIPPEPTTKKGFFPFLRRRDKSSKPEVEQNEMTFALPPAHAISRSDLGLVVPHAEAVPKAQQAGGNLGPVQEDTKLKSRSKSPPPADKKRSVDDESPGTRLNARPGISTSEKPPTPSQPKFGERTRAGEVTQGTQDIKAPAAPMKPVDTVRLRMTPLPLPPVRTRRVPHDIENRKRTDLDRHVTVTRSAEPSRHARVSRPHISRDNLETTAPNSSRPRRVGDEFNATESKPKGLMVSFDDDDDTNSGDDRPVAPEEASQSGDESDDPFALDSPRPSPPPAPPSSNPDIPVPSTPSSPQPSPMSTPVPSPLLSPEYSQDGGTSPLDAPSTPQSHWLEEALEDLPIAIRAPDWKTIKQFLIKSRMQMMVELGMVALAVYALHMVWV